MNNHKTYIVIAVSLTMAAVIFGGNIFNFGFSSKIEGNINNNFNINNTKSSIKILPVSEGRVVKIEEVFLPRSGFVIIKRVLPVKESTIIGASRFLPKGNSKGILVVLSSEVIRGEELSAEVYFDNGDKVFSPEKDTSESSKEESYTNTNFNVI